MKITIKSPLVQRTIAERAAFNITASFWNDSTEVWTASTPTTVKYRLDSLDSGNTITDWTTVTAASSVTITASPSANAILYNQNDRERRQITVKADDGLSTQYQTTYKYYVSNLVGQT